MPPIEALASIPFLSIIMQTESVDYEFLFWNNRLIPWVPDHKQKILAYAQFHSGNKAVKSILDAYAVSLDNHIAKEQVKIDEVDRQWREKNKEAFAEKEKSVEELVGTKQRIEQELRLIDEEIEKRKEIEVEREKLEKLKEDNKDNEVLKKVEKEEKVEVKEDVVEKPKKRGRPKKSLPIE